MSTYTESMKKLLGILVLGLLWCSVNETALAGDCDAIISGERETALTCADNDTLAVSGSIIITSDDAVDAEGEDGVTITITNNTGSIQATGTNTDDAILGTSSLNLTVDNSGTIFAGRDYGIKLQEAEIITITNRATGKIKTTKGLNGSQAAVGGTLMGNCSTCVGGASSTGIGLTLHNYGSIEANEESVYG